MKIVIDTKEDLQNMRHILKLLHAIAGNLGKIDYEDLYKDSGSSVPETPTGAFNMFDSPSSNLLDEKKDDDSSGPLQVY